MPAYRAAASRAYDRIEQLVGRHRALLRDHAIRRDVLGALDPRAAATWSRLDTSTSMPTSRVSGGGHCLASDAQLEHLRFWSNVPWLGSMNSDVSIDWMSGMLVMQ